MSGSGKILVLGLGNDFIADDGIGILTARELGPLLQGRADVVECCESGIRLMEYLMDYDKAILLDAICTAKNPPGTLIELFPSDLSSVVAPSPHYAGLPEIFALARQMEVRMPQDLVILAVEVEDPLTIGGEMTPAVKNSIPVLIERVLQQIHSWIGECSHA